MQPKTKSNAQAETMEPETAVVFRRWRPERGDHGIPGAVFALFPLLAETRPGQCVSYEHVGQHSAADYSACVARSRPVSLEDAECVALRRELESIGYRLRPIKRAPHWSKVSEARRAAGL